MDLWDWIFDRREEYEAAGDATRSQLTYYWDRVYPLRERDPAQALALLGEGCHLAEELGERWWAMVLNHWRLQALMLFKRDYSQAVELAVRNSVAASKSENAAFPGRLGIYRDLVCAYNGVDHDGYADLILQTLHYLDGAIPPGPNTDRYVLYGNKRHFHNLCGDFAAVEAVFEQVMDLIHRDPERQRAAHHLTFNYSALCWMTHRKQDWHTLAEAAAAGEQAARVVGHQLELAEFLMWQAVLARRDGDELRARRLYSTAEGKMARLQMPPDRFYPDATALFHEVGGDLEKALEVRQRELVVNEKRGQLAYESETHIKRCTLWAKMGLLRTEHLDGARQAALKLRKPEKPLAQIDQVITSL
jgi:hypothetical protein